MPKTAFAISHPARLRSCVVFASPHSGRDYPASLLDQTVLDHHAIRSSEDAFVDDLFDHVTEFGAPFIKAGAPRAYVDLNRSWDEMDPALVRGAMRLGHNPRVASGLGVIPRVVANGRAIYSGKITLAEAQQRLDEIWHPYHESLQGLLSQAQRRFGQAVLIDCHSMPHEAVAGAVRKGMRAPDVVLGDRFGAAASGDVVDRLEVAFTDAGFKVARNSPFAGAYITQAYGRPSQGQHAVQVELDRSLYMDETSIRPTENFVLLKETLRRVTAEITRIGQSKIPLAAE